MSDPRSALRQARTIVVKIGSRPLAAGTSALESLAAELSSLRHAHRFVLVTSGAVALGTHRLGYKQRPSEVAKLQAAAAAGQSLLMHQYDEAFGRQGVTTAQVLLTHADLASRTRLNNARNALSELLEAGAIPIINENDVVSVAELRFGDNDQLSSQVTPLVSADLLILLTDVNGVLDPDGQRISIMRDDTTIGTVERTGAVVGTGGIHSKIDAARKATRCGARVVIAPANEANVISRVIQGEELGTLFLPQEESLTARKHWIAYTLRPRGTLILDEGASKAVVERGSSLLPVGILGVRGRFRKGDAVRLVNGANEELARGLVRFGAAEIAAVAGQRSEDLEAEWGSEQDPVIVHRNDLVSWT